MIHPKLEVRFFIQTFPFCFLFLDVKSYLLRKKWLWLQKDFIDSYLWLKNGFPGRNGCGLYISFPRAKNACGSSPAQYGTVICYDE